MVHEEIDSIISAYGTEKRYLIPILQDVQAQYHYLPQEVLKYVSEQLNLPLIDVYSLATFYNCFSLNPRGKHLIRVCLGTACHLKGGTRLVETIRRELSVPEGDVTPDGDFTYNTVRCLGCCSLAPLVVIDERYHPKMSSRKITQLIKRIQKSDGHPSNGKGKGNATECEIKAIT